MPGAVAKLREQDGGEIHVMGSGDLIQTLLAHDLVDELSLMIFPVVLGTGKRLFGEGTVPAAFRLAESRTTSSGVVICRYRAGRRGHLGTYELYPGSAPAVRLGPSRQVRAARHDPRRVDARRAWRSSAA